MFELSLLDGVARLALDRPEARNAVPAKRWAELAAACAEAEAQGARALILSGRGGAFCAGADLNDFPGMRADPAAASAFRTGMRDALAALAALPMPTLAVIEGACYGAGLALAIACDVRFCGPGARFAVTPARLGIGFPQEDVHRLVALVGRGHAARLLLTAASIDAAEAARIGLVETCFADGLDAAVQAFTAAVLGNDAASLRLLKRGVALAATGTAADAEQDRGFDALLGGEALAQRLAARRSERVRSAAAEREGI